MNLLIPITIIVSFLITSISIKPSDNKTNTLSASTSFPTPSIEAQTSSQPLSPVSKKDSNVIIEITNTTSSSTNTKTVYPGAMSIGENTYESSDSPETITVWYKNVISEKNMNTTSFVSTNTNDNIKNVLAADNGNQKLHVEILRNAGDTKTTIKFL